MALWPLWLVIRSQRAWASLAALPVAGLVATMLAATVSVTGAVPEYAAIRDSRSRLIAALDDGGFSQVHGGYWTCNWITYLTAEEIVCGVVDDSGQRASTAIPRTGGTGRTRTWPRSAPRSTPNWPAAYPPPCRRPSPATTSTPARAGSGYVSGAPGSGR